MNQYKLIFSFIVCSILFAACQQKKSFSDQEYLTFIENVLQEIYQEKGDLLNESIDYDVYIERVMDEETEFKSKELLDFLQKNFKPGTTMAKYVAEGADIRFVRFYRSNDTAHAIFRTYYNGGISVEDWEFGQQDGKIMVNDAFSIVSGIHWSDDWRMKACMHFGVVNDNTILIDQLMEINYLISQEKFMEADSSYFWIEQAAKNNLYARTMQLNLASLHQSYDDVMQLTKVFLKSFPDRQTISEFYLLQSAIKQGLVDSVLLHAHHLTQLIGPDPIYFVYLSWAYKHANRLDEHLQALDSAIFYMPQVYDFYHNKLDVFYETANYSEFVKELYAIDSIFAPTGEDIPFYDQTYPKLLEVKEYNEWKQHRPQQQVMY